MRNDSRRNRITRIKDKILDILFPLRCPVCDDIVPIGNYLICEECKKRIKYIKEPRCRKCGRQLRDSNQIFCKDCSRKRHVFDYGYALYDYRSMKLSIYRFKYKKRCEYAKFYGYDIYRRLGREINKMEADAIIPIPIHSSRRQERGYNQAELIANELSKYTGIPVYNVVERVKNTKPQKLLDPRERQNNLKKAFIINADVVKLKKTILIDDIYTTGSTLDAVAYELRRKGVEEVFFISLSIGEGI